MKWSRKYGAFKVRFIRSGLMTHGADVCTRSKTYARDSHGGDYCVPHDIRVDCFGRFAKKLILKHFIKQNLREFPWGIKECSSEESIQYYSIHHNAMSAFASQACVLKKILYLKFTFRFLCYSLCAYWTPFRSNDAKPFAYTTQYFSIF